MIKPDEIRDLMPRGEELEKRIDACIKNAAIVGRWPAKISTKGEPRGVVDIVVARYVAAGWRAEFVLDPRDGDFVQIEQP